MKTIDELGISPWPWHTFDDNWVESADGSPAMSNAAYACNQNDARLMAASPKLYEALYDACSRRCLYCKLREADGSCNQPEGDCVVQQWKKVLDEAAGEEVK